MATCSSCGLEMDSRRPVPPRCPRCGAETGAARSGDWGPGDLAPPAFAGDPADGSESGNTLFGVPTLDELTAPLGADAPSQPAPGGEAFGMPSIGLDALDAPTTSSADPSQPAFDPTAFDLSAVGDEDGALELDLPDRPFGSPEGKAPVPPPPPSAAIPGPPPPAPARPTMKAPQAPPPAPPRPPPAPGRGVPPPVPAMRPPAPPPPRPPPARAAAPAPEEIDLPAPVPPRPRRPGVPPGLDLPAPVGPKRKVARPPDFDFPAPAAPVAPKGPPGLDLPTPRGPGGAPDFDLPAPAAGPRGDASALDLPTPRVPGGAPDFDLLAPAGRGGAPDFDLPAPAGPGGASDFDLPAPSGPAGLTPPPPFGTAPGVDLPQPVGPGKVPSAPELDLPAPAELDLPTPAGLDLPTPVDFDLPEPVGLDLPEPAGMQVEPAGMHLEPADMHLEPADNQLQPAQMGLAPADAGLLEPKVGKSKKKSKAEIEDEAQVDHRRSPTPKALPGERVSRGLLYGGAAVVLLAALGVGMMYAGVFDDEPPPRVRGAPRPGGGESQPADAPPGAVPERSGDVLAAFAADTPQRYHEAMTAAEAAGDAVGKAEAALLLHLRYGPDPVLVGQATSLLQPYAADTEPQVRRVIGLAALAAGDEAGAAAALVGDDTRTRLYRGFLAVDKGEWDQAITEAEAVLAAVPDDLAGVQLRAQAVAAKDPQAGLVAVKEAADAHPDHPGLQELLVRTAIGTGDLAMARVGVERLHPADDAPKAYRGRVLALKGDLAAAGGDYAGAVEDYGAALELEPGNEAVELARVRALMKSKELTDALVAVSEAVEGHPESVDAHLLQVEVDIASGKGDEALAKLGELAGQLPDSPRVPYLVGQVYAMRLQTDEANAAFDQALEKDPTYYQAALARAEMLSTARQFAPALAQIEVARKLVGDAGDDPKALATVLLAKARLLEGQHQTTAALVALDDALTAAPTDNASQLMRGKLRLEEGRYAEGKADLEAVFRRTGGYPGLTGPLGRIFLQEKRLDDLERLLGDRASHPTAPIDVKLLAARLKLAKGDPEGAKVLLDEVLARDTTSWEAQMLMAQAFLDTGDYQEAMARIALAKPKTPQAELHLLEGKILEYNGKYDEARPEYQKAIAIDPDLHEARFLYGRSLGFAGANKQAVEQIQYAIDQTGDRFPEAYLELGRALKQLGNTKEALTALSKAESLQPDLYEAFYLEGRIDYEANQAKAAASALTQATVDAAKDQSWYPDALVFLGKAQEKAGNTAVAKAAYKKFLEVARPDHPSRPQVEDDLRKLH